MRRFFRNIPWKNVLIIALVAILGIGAIVAVTSIAKNDTKTISATEFKRGAIDSNGFYVESDTSIYTKDLIECQGLEIAPDFEATGSYQVFYYSKDKVFVGATELRDCQSDGVYVKGSSYSFAKYCRIMIIPETPKDDYGNIVENYNIKFYEVAGIANKLVISVYKEQNFYADNLFVVNEDYIGRTVLLASDGSGSYSFVDTPEYSACSFIDVSEIKQLKILYPASADSGMYNYFFFDSTGKVISSGNAMGSFDVSILNVPSNATQFICSYEGDSIFEIYMFE